MDSDRKPRVGDAAPRRRRSDRGIRLHIHDGRSSRVRRASFGSALRCGYGDDCEFNFEGEPGPDVLFELERSRGPIRLSTAVPRELLDERVELTVDGRSVHEGVQELEPGSRIQIVDKRTRRRYDLVVEPRPFWLVRPWFLAVVLLVLAAAGAVYGGYVYRTLSGTRALVTDAQSRLARAERGVERAERRMTDAFARVASAEQGLIGAVAALERLQTESNVELREEFGRRLERIGERARQELSRLSEQDTRGREALAAETRVGIEAVRAELAARMVGAYREFKEIEQRLLDTISSRVGASAPDGGRFKAVLGNARQAVLFIQTRYELEFATTGEAGSFSSFGTGFVVDESGFGMTAQHVLFPWRYEREFLVLSELGLVRLRPGSVRHAAWRLGEEVMRPGSDPPEPREDTGHHSESRERPFRFIHAPLPSTSEELVAAPAGVARILVPLPDRTDAAAFQIMEFDRPFTPLALGPAGSAPEPLDKVLVVGYPLSRLEGRLAVPQGVLGFVRRSGADVTELDTPMHPGISGAPVLDGDGRVVGMALAVLSSVVYGMAARGEDVARFLDEARLAARAEEERLLERGCDPGVVDGHFDRDTLAAYRCEWRAEDAAAGQHSRPRSAPPGKERSAR